MEWRRLSKAGVAPMGEPSPPHDLHKLPVIEELAAVARRTCNRFGVGSSADAEDVAQEAYARILEAAHLAPLPRRRLMRIMMRTARNLCIDQHRNGRRHEAWKRQANQEWRDRETDALDLRDQRVELYDLTAQLHGYLRELAEVSRRGGRAALVLRLRYWLELKEDEIARVLQISRKTVQRRIEFGVSWLRKTISGSSTPGSI